jgi:hypothetical protein
MVVIPVPEIASRTVATPAGALATLLSDALALQTSLAVIDPCPACEEAPLPLQPGNVKIAAERMIAEKYIHDLVNMNSLLLTIVR